MSRLRSAHSLQRFWRPCYRSLPSIAHTPFDLSDDKQFTAVDPSGAQQNCWRSIHLACINVRGYASVSADGQTAAPVQRTSEAMAVLKVCNSLLAMLEDRLIMRCFAACKAGQAQRAVAAGI